MAQLVKNKTTRTTMSYARYLMSVHLGRILEKYEHVDHINNNRLDDRVENFQILTQVENNRKYSAINPARVTEFICPVCETPFTIPTRNVPFRSTQPSCSKKCSSIKLSKNFE